MKVLLVDDNREYCDTLAARLLPYTFIVDAVYESIVALEKLREHQYELVILDLHLPDMSGRELLEHIQRLPHPPRVLILSVDIDTAVKTQLLNAGADDYLEKPFALDELVARLRALLRRPHAVVPELFRIDTLVLDVHTHSVSRDDTPIALTQKEFALLVHLLRHRGALVTKDSLCEHVWNDTALARANALETHIANLRRKLGEPSIIHTVHGCGYKVE